MFVFSFFAMGQFLVRLLSSIMSFLSAILHQHAKNSQSLPRLSKSIPQNDCSFLRLIVVLST